LGLLAAIEEETSVNRDTSTLPPHFRRNFFAFIGDYVFYGIASSFSDPGTVAPTFVGMLTDSEPLIGLVGTVWAAGWLLPQLVGAAVMNGRPRKKPYLMAMAYTGRPLMLLLALTMWAGLPRYPTPMLTIFFIMYGLFMLLDGVASVAWFDILARAVPLSRRGRLIGVAQLVSGVMGVGVGAAVEAILASPALPFPRNYALLFTLSALAHAPSVLALSLIREPPAIEPATVARPSLRKMVRQLAEVWRQDADFRRLMATRWLTGLMDLAVTFYVLHAGEEFGVPQGRLLAARMAGGILASLGFGWLSERRGPRLVIWIGGVAAVSAPLLALLLHLIQPASVVVASLSYAAIYVLLGITMSSRMLGHLNYTMEMAADEQRAIYIGLANTLAGLLVPASILGGVLLEASSYPVLFIVTAVCTGGGLVASLRLRDLSPGRQERHVRR
jgi:MFS family permease